MVYSDSDIRSDSDIIRRDRDRARRPINLDVQGLAGAEAFAFNAHRTVGARKKRAIHSPVLYLVRDARVLLQSAV
jgi:hypothetical protein